MRSQEYIRENFNSASGFWTELYNKFTPESYIVKSRLQIMANYLKQVKGLRILDVGCATGVYAGFLKESNIYNGLDLSPKMVMKAKDKYSQFPSVNFSVGSIINLPIKSNSIDLILCLGVLEYIDDIKFVIGEISRVLKPDSTIYISMQNPASLYRFWENHIYPYFKDLKKRLKGNQIDGKIEKNYSLREIKVLLGENGLQVKDVRFYNFNLWLKPFDRFFPKLVYRTTKLLDVLERIHLYFFAGDFLLKVGKD